MGYLATGAGRGTTSAFGHASVESPLNRPRCYLKCATTHRNLDRLEIEAIDGSLPYQPYDLRGNFCIEGFLEAPFLRPGSCEAAAVASSWVSAHVSQACQ